jgi:hypothetical protein
MTGDSEFDEVFFTDVHLPPIIFSDRCTRGGTSA